MTDQNSRIGLQFPGQGAQTVGMGADLYEQAPLARETFDRANEVLGYDLAEICFEGPSETLTETRHSQPAILVTSLALYRVLQETLTDPLEPAAVAGLSLGEYTALVAAGGIRFHDALELVQIRAEAMQKDCDREPSGMISLLGLEYEQVKELVEQAQDDGIVGIANYNSPGQIVVSGNTSGLESIHELAEAAGARRVIPLKVAGAFHSPLMKPARQRLASALEEVEFRSPEYPIITNTTGKAVDDPEAIRTSLEQQVTSTVLWEPTVRTFLEMGVNSFLEVGPGRVLSGLARRISDDTDIQNIQTIDDLNEFVSPSTESIE